MIFMPKKLPCVLNCYVRNALMPLLLKMKQILPNCPYCIIPCVAAILFPFQKSIQQFAMFFIQNVFCAMDHFQRLHIARCPSM